MSVRSDTLRKRVASILELQALVFDSPAAGLELGSGDDFAALAEALGDPSPEQIRQLKSIVRAHALLFSGGPLGADDETARESARLLAYLSGLAKAREAAPSRAAVMPRTLGMSFAKKGLGAPLFGLYRPASPPASGGLVLRYQSADADGTARLSACRADRATTLRYSGYGVEISGAGGWLSAILPPAGVDWKERAGRLLGRKAPWVRDYGSYAMAIGATALAWTTETEFVDPFEYRYAYYFYPGTERTNLARFVRGLLSGSFGVATRDAEEAADVFSARSP